MNKEETTNDNILVFIIRKIWNDIIESSNDPVNSACFFIYSILLIFIFIMPFFLYNIANNDVPINQDTMNGYVFYIFLFIGLFAMIIFLQNQNKIISSDSRNVNAIITFIIIMIIVGFLYCIMYFYNNIDKIDEKYSFYMNLLLYAIVILIVIVALALSYKIFINKFRQNSGGVIGFVINLIFFIPCLFNDFIEFIKYQYKITPSVVYILLIIEILLIIAFVYIPIVIDSNINKNKILLLPNSSYLDKSEYIGNSNDLAPFIQKDLYGNEIKTPRINYGLSMWIYINQPKNLKKIDKLINIFSYGSEDSMKPQISYYGKHNENESNNIYRITFTGSQQNGEIVNDNSYDIKLTNQKWNNIFFNYYSDHVDLFINGNLERTFNINNNYPKYTLYDKIRIGDDNGIDGAICNIAYYKNELSKFQITNLYNLLINKNPPINNII